MDSDWKERQNMHTHTIALVISTPTDGVRSNTCLQNHPEQPGVVLGLKAYDKQGTGKPSKIFHLWDDITAQSQDPRLSKDLKSFVSALGASDILHLNALESLERFNALLELCELSPIDTCVEPIDTLIETPYTDLDHLLFHLGVANCDLNIMYQSSLRGLDVLDHAWKVYFKPKFHAHMLAEDASETTKWTDTLNAKEKDAFDTNIKDPVDQALHILTQMGLSEDILERLNPIEVMDGI
jgi:hypothetical protein